MRSTPALAFLALLTAFARAAPDIRPQFQVINGHGQSISIYWLNPDGSKVLSGTVAPGQSQLIATTIGHEFLITNGRSGQDRKVTAELPVRAYRYPSAPTALPHHNQIILPPPGLALPAFYTQCISAHGFPIVASASVSPFALKESAWLADQMLAHRPDVRTAMIKSGARMCIIAHNEFTTDLPEFSHLKCPSGYEPLSGKKYWDARARGTGGSQTDPHCTCAEENVLAYPGDPYQRECILIHEFAHNIHLRGLVNVDPTFDRRLKQAYDEAMARNLWAGKYPSVNHHEYFAEGVQSW
ncbi:MAG TPA: hypothetical protein VD994_12100, partial [Prosthecobacter sp.]|nr:hypothetical protein [Prosthecobacter sp.]